MTSKSVKKQLLLSKKSANRGRKMIRRVTKKIVPRTEVYAVWNAYLDCFYEDLLLGKEVKGMANVGSFIIEKKRISAAAMALRMKGLHISRGNVQPIRKLNLNNLDYIFKVNFINTKGIKFYPCKKLRVKMFETISKGRDFRECRLIG